MLTLHHSDDSYRLLLRSVQHCKSRKQAREARCAQWNERLCGLQSLPLQYSHSVVTDAIDRKHRAIGSTDEARQKCYSRKMDARYGLVAILLDAPEGRSSEFVTLSHRL